MKINFEDNKGIAIHLANKYAWLYERIGLTRQDAMQISYLALAKAIKRFDASRGIKFSTLAFSIIKWDLLGFIKREKYIPALKKDREKFDFKNLKSLDKKISFSTETTLGSTLLATSSSDVDIEKINISLAIEKLSIKEKYFIVAKYFEDFTNKEIAQMMKVSYPTAQRLDKKALNSLKNLISC